MQNSKLFSSITDALVPGLSAVKASQKMMQNEKYEDADVKNEIQVEQNVLTVFDKLGGIFNILIFAAAAYLSWSCNTKCYKQMGGIEKTIRAFFAGFFGIIYLIIYMISWSADCNKCSDVFNPINPIMPPQNIYF